MGETAYDDDAHISAVLPSLSAPSTFAPASIRVFVVGEPASAAHISAVLPPMSAASTSAPAATRRRKISNDGFASESTGIAYEHSCSSGVIVSSALALIEARAPLASSILTKS